MNAELSPSIFNFQLSIFNCQLTMAYYDLSKAEREAYVVSMKENIRQDLEANQSQHIVRYFSDEDTYIRKNGYLLTGRIYAEAPSLQSKIIELLHDLMGMDDFKIRQTVVNSAGEIGKKEFDAVVYFFDTGLLDKHHSVRNAVIGSIKKMGEKNPKPVLAWSEQYLHHPDKEIRREICHGIELRGRTHPQDILPLLRSLEFDKTARVRNTLVHVLGQIAYKKGCLETVVQDLKTWKNEALVKAALAEIIDVHDRYKNFSVLTQAQAEAYIRKEMPTFA